MRKLGMMLSASMVMVSFAAKADGDASARHDAVLKLEENTEQMMKIATPVVANLQPKESLDTWLKVAPGVRDSVAKIQANESLLTPAEVQTAKALEARATKWADETDKTLTAEKQAREDVIVPLCEAIWIRDQAKAFIAHERANPSGVVDLRALHQAGEHIQQAEAQIAALKPPYQSFRKHAFTTWQTEGACVYSSKHSDEP